MRPLILLLLALGTTVVQAQTHTASVIGHCQSLLLRSVTNYTSSGFPADLHFTTYDGNTATPPLRQPITGGFLYSGELRPRGAGAYEMDYSVIKDADGSYLSYGSVVLNLPTTDSDNNGLPDMAQFDKAGTVALTGTYTQDSPTSASVAVNGNLTRAASALTGTFNIVDVATGGNQVNVTGGLELLRYTGSISYARGALNTVTFSCQRTNAGVVFSLTGTTTFTVVTTSQFTLPSFTLTNATDNSVYTVQAATFNRTGNRYVGALTFADGDTRTAWADHLNWAFEFTDLNDFDSNGIPDLTDALPPPPVITSTLTATATVGQSFSYTITANNSPAGFGATGLPAGLSVNGASGLISGTPTAAGTFNVTLSATNDGGTGNASLTLTVNLPPPPIITAQPQGQTLNVGASVTFSVTATGVAPLSYQWQKDGTNLASATGTSYAIASVQTNHAGSYTVVVGNFGGSVTSSPALLLVNRLTQIITFGALSAKQFGNAPFALTATSSSGLPVGYSSSLPSVATVSGSTVTLVAAGTTSITASQPGNSTYLPAASVSQSLLVNPATPVITSAGSATAIAGQSFSYTITANNSPTGFGATGLPSGLSVYAANGVISGTPTGASTNTVTLSASNAGGTGTKTLTLTVNLPPPPDISTQPVHTTVSPGGPFTLSVAATGTALTYQWKKGGVNITGATNSTFALPAAQSGDAGSYSVVVNDPYGQSATSAVVTLSLVTLQMYAGLTLEGPVGTVYRMDYATNLSAPVTWTTLNAVTLTASPQDFVDFTSKGQPKRFYRAVPQ